MGLVENVITDGMSVSRSVKDLAKLSLKSPIYVSPDEQDDKSTPDSLVEVRLIIISFYEALQLNFSFYFTDYCVSREASSHCLRQK